MSLRWLVLHEIVLHQEIGGEHGETERCKCRLVKHKGVVNNTLRNTQFLCCDA